MTDPIDNILSNINSGVKSGLEKAKDTGDWISVEDRLPNNMEQVLCYKENEYVIRVFNEGDWFGEWMNSTMNYKQEIEPIEFWTSLPEPPNV